MLCCIATVLTHMSKEICIHHLEHARIAFDIAQELGKHIVLSTPPQALSYASVDYFRELFNIAQDKYPSAQVKCIIDCSGHPGMAMYALRQGVNYIRYLDDQKFTQQLLSMAQQQEATLFTSLPESILDLLDQENAREACYSWISPRIATSNCSVL